MKKIMTLAMVVLLSSVMVHHKPALGVSCAPQAIAKAYEEFDGIIVGRVETIRHKEHPEVTVTVSKSYKGIQDERVIFKEMDTWGPRWEPNEIGGQYLFFLSVRDGIWENQLCSPTVKLDEAAKELQFLRGKEIPIAGQSAEGMSASEQTSVIIWVIGAALFIALIIYGFIHIRDKKAERR